MSKKDDDILARAFAGLGGMGGEIGGGRAGRWGGSHGARFVAKLLPNNIYETSIDVPAQPALVLSLATNILRAEGELLDVENIPGTLVVKGLTGAGFSNMNPTIVTVSIAGGPPQQTHVTIQGNAKEGLIKQRAGEKAAQRIAQQLLDQLK